MNFLYSTGNPGTTVLVVLGGINLPFGANQLNVGNSFTYNSATEEFVFNTAELYEIQFQFPAVGITVASTLELQINGNPIPGDGESILSIGVDITRQTVISVAANDTLQVRFRFSNAWKCSFMHYYYIFSTLSFI